MLRVLGSRRQMCGGPTRRDFLCVGGLSALGFGLEDFLRARAAPAAAPVAAANFGKARACILLFAYGSPPQHETFDPKPEAPAEVRGEMKAIPTRLPGVQICGHLPHVAQVLDRVTVVRSMTHPYPVHGVAYATSGIATYNPILEVNPRDPQHWPYIGSVVDYVLEKGHHGRIPEVPRNMVLPWKMNSRNGGIATAGPYAAFLGPAYDPVVADFLGEASRVIEKTGRGKSVQVSDPFAGVRPDVRFQVGGADPDTSIALDRLDRRRSLLQQFDQARGPWESRAARSFDRFQQMAVSVLAGSKIRQALDVGREPPSLRESYGMTLFGQACLTARRLVEAGSTFVTVFWDEVGPIINADWDTHWDMYRRLKGWLLPGFDRAFAGLITDLEQRGLLDETLVIWMSEHGRSPRINKEAGRDHWSRVYSIALAGGGIARGKVIGQSDRLGADVTQTAVSPKDILATIVHLLGIDPNTHVPDPLQRPLRIVGQGEVRTELF
jgi:hypothetical protein